MTVVHLPSGASHFGRHLAEMTGAMLIGMLASATIYLAPSGMTPGEALREHPMLFVVVQAAGMTLAMVGWMRVRGNDWRSCEEMAAAMGAPAIALICLRLVGVVSGPICGTYCMLSFAAMVALMLYRRRTSIGTAGPLKAL